MQTGYYVDSHNYIYGPQYGGQFYIIDSHIYGPKNYGVYYIDGSGQVCGPNGQTGFSIVGTYVYGPSTQLPWFS
jgi:hypothetical protein